jgi:hypothetical protein
VRGGGRWRQHRKFFMGVGGPPPPPPPDLNIVRVSEGRPCPTLSVLLLA